MSVLDLLGMIVIIDIDSYQYFLKNKFLKKRLQNPVAVTTRTFSLDIPPYPALLDIATFSPAAESSSRRHLGPSRWGVNLRWHEVGTKWG